ncbi:MAG TPA: hypothetical protein VJL84_07085, partial [Kiloniellales bacterium]|nr:hypothetical protein [Kiloniellales bacterium]
MPRASRFLACLAVALTGASAAEAAGWSCRNEDLEIRCDWDGCQSVEDFTPMEVHVAGDGTMEICAYSGCWRGQANQRVQSNRWILLAAERMQWMGSGG